MANARDEIRAWLRTHRLQQREFAVQLGISPEHLSRILGDAVPGLTLRKFMALVTGLNVEDTSSWT